MAPVPSLRGRFVFRRNSILMALESREKAKQGPLGEPTQDGWPAGECYKNQRQPKSFGLRGSLKKLSFVGDFGGRGRDRTGGLLVANEALSQLSYTPTAGALV
jgi:hypothetical protein